MTDTTIPVRYFYSAEVVPVGRSEACMRLFEHTEQVPLAALDAPVLVASWRDVHDLGARRVWWADDRYWMPAGDSTSGSREELTVDTLRERSRLGSQEVSPLLAMAVGSPGLEDPEGWPWEGHTPAIIEDFEGIVLNDPRPIINSRLASIARRFLVHEGLVLSACDMPGYTLVELGTQASLVPASVHESSHTLVAPSLAPVFCRAFQRIYGTPVEVSVPITVHDTEHLPGQFVCPDPDVRRVILELIAEEQHERLRTEPVRGAVCAW